MWRQAFGILLVLWSLGSVMAGGEDQRPNILWISCEDISPHLGCYGDRHVRTPNLDQLAREGILFTHAFSCHGVCAPSRTGIITGMSPITLGANHMRSKVRLPAHVRLFPSLLRDAGYYCTNNSKTDYNLEWKEQDVWDENSNKAHWKHRKRADQPFFAVFNLTMTHESKVWPTGWQSVVRDLPANARQNPMQMEVPPIYPDTAAVREDQARLRDLITVMDQRVGELLQELENAGESERTIVMFWSDHGDGLPRAKRWTYDSGTRVPLLMRIPERFRQQTGALQAGVKDERMVSLLDLGPTVLALAGVSRPDHMQGKSVLGESQHAGYRWIYGARDRLDERQDLVRSVRSRQYRYVRNLMPWYPALQHVSYGEQNETMKAMRQMQSDGTLPDSSKQWFGRRAAEELYDLAVDPWEQTNLAGREGMGAILDELRGECDRWQESVLDVHVIPEVLMDEEARVYGGVRGEIFAAPDGRVRWKRILEAAKAAARGHTDESVAPVRDADRVVYWWNLLGRIHGGKLQESVEDFRAALGHSEAAIRLLGAIGLARAGQLDEAAPEIEKALNSSDALLRQAAMREVDEAGAEICRRFVPGVKNVGKDEYFQRLLEHAQTRL